MRGKRVLVTGASSGIGRETALAFAEEGAWLSLAARREERLVEVARECERRGGRAVAVRCDVTREEDVRRLMAATEEAFGGLDVLVNNAGVGLYGPLERVSQEQLERVFEVNVFGLSRVTRLALPLLRRRAGGRIVNVSSVLGHRGLPMLSGYCASKAAVNSLTEAWRVELSPEGIGVSLVSPGLTESEFRDARMHAEGYEQEQVPLEAMGAAEVARAILRAARTGRRDTVLTLPGRAMAYANRLSPRLFDRIARRMVGAPKASAK